jgi:hypothetical protein
MKESGSYEELAVNSNMKLMIFYKRNAIHLLYKTQKYIEYHAYKP